MKLEWLAALVVSMLMPVAAAHAQRTDNPHGERIGSCVTCHAPDSWRPVRISKDFKHAERTFPLDGAHLRTTCTGCHKNLVFAKVTSTCASCHTDVHQRELGTDCARCHTTRSFVDQGQLKRMHELTRFPLRGSHSAARCDACHAPATPGRPQYTGRSTACMSCHAADYRQAKAPDHLASQFSQDCASCHVNSSWRNARFDHSATRFALDGAHKAVSCTSCHADKVFHGKSMECVSCHQADYNRSANPPHSPGFPTTCANCHSVAGWKDAKFDHNATRFALTGSHRTATCVACHADKIYRGKPTACASCHQAKFDVTTRPPHTASGLPNTCEVCHTTTAWTPGTFNHANTRFPLLGAHLAPACAACHGDGVYRGKSTTCISCHQRDYDAAVPPHASLGYSTVCGDCHSSTTTWKGAAFNHQLSAFPLNGAHLAVACSSCHGDNVYKGKSTACVSCHQASYAATTNPPHAAASFPTTCEACHSTSSWLTATFNHATTRFPLTGAHSRLTCNGCHADRVYRGKTMVCSGCHLAAYTATTSPKHSAASFPTTCESCHGTTSWLGATFDHASFFPIYSGNHMGKWRVCTDCHTSPTNYVVFSCFQCHLQKDMDDRHRGRSGYSYDSAKCYACHPRGGG